MGKKTTFDDLIDDMRKKVKKKEATTAYSKPALYQITNALLNSPEYEFETYVSKDDKPVPVTSTPVRDHRDALKTLIKNNFGLPDEELSKLDEANLPKNYTNSVIDVGVAAISGYLDTEKKLTFPMTDENSTVMSVQKETAPERVREKRVIEKQEDGTYVSKTTGEMLRARERTVIKATNKVPAWLMDGGEEGSSEADE